jgi:hypothetical protein
MNKSTIGVLEIIFQVTISILCIVCLGYLEGIPSSISMYATFESTAWIFKCWMIILAHGSLKSNLLKFTALPLVGMAIFDTGSSFFLINEFHLLSAICFYLICAISLLKIKKSKSFGFALILFAGIIPLSIYWAEIFLILTLCLYYLITAKKLSHKI